MSALTTLLNSIPIYVTLNYSFYTMKFPINPEELQMDVDSSSDTVEVIGLGEVNIPKTPKPRTLQINSFFWDKGDSIMLPPAQYVSWIKTWQTKKIPANLIITRLNYSMKVICENFTYSTKAGEEDCIYFNLSLKEYIPYSAKRIGFQTNTTLIQRIQALEGITSPILVDVPKPTRDTILKDILVNPYRTKDKDTLASITKLFTGSSDAWKELYNENKSTFAEAMLSETAEELKANTKIIIPDSWIEKYGVSSEDNS